MQLSMCLPCPGNLSSWSPQAPQGAASGCPSSSPCPPPRSTPRCLQTPKKSENTCEWSKGLRNPDLTPHPNHRPPLSRFRVLSHMLSNFQTCKDYCTTGLDGSRTTIPLSLNMLVSRDVRKHTPTSLFRWCYTNGTVQPFASFNLPSALTRTDACERMQELYMPFHT